MNGIVTVRGSSRVNLINHPGQLSLDITKWVGETSTSDGPTTVGEERRVLRNNRPCYQHCWHTDHNR